MKVTFTENALVEYIFWQQEDKKTLKRNNPIFSLRNAIRKGADYKL